MDHLNRFGVGVAVSVQIKKVHLTNITICDKDLLYHLSFTRGKMQEKFKLASI